MHDFVLTHALIKFLADADGQDAADLRVKLQEEVRKERERMEELGATLEFTRCVLDLMRDRKLLDYDKEYSGAEMADELRKAMNDEHPGLWKYWNNKALEQVETIKSLRKAIGELEAENHVLKQRLAAAGATLN